MNPKDGNYLKSLVLSAGLGTRLRPLTDQIPKPLAPVMNTPLIEAALFRCHAAGAQEVAINVFHLPDLMISAATKVCERMGAFSPFISRESPEILGTGGALAQISNWWGASSLLVYNGDILSDIDLLDLVTRHREGRSIVTMVVRSQPPTDGGRSVWVSPYGDVKAICKKEDLPAALAKSEIEECGFACAYVAEPQLKEFLPNPAEFYDIIVAFNEAIASGKRVRALKFDGFWADVGNPRSLWETNLLVSHLSQSKVSQLLGKNNVQRVLSQASDVSIDAVSIVGADVKLGRGATIVRSVLLDGAIVESGELVQDTIRGLGLNDTF